MRKVLTHDRQVALSRLSQGENAFYWEQLQAMYDEMIDAAQLELEGSSDTVYLYRMQGEIAALRKVAKLRNQAINLLGSKNK
jgi:hypothetical protein